MTDDEIRKLIGDEVAAHVARYHRKGGHDKPETAMEWNFEKARKEYPGKKRGFRVEFDYFCAEHPEWQDLLDDDGLYECVKILKKRVAYSDGWWPMWSKFVHNSLYEMALEEWKAAAKR